MALTGEPRRWGSEPSITGVVHFLGPYLYRSSFGATTEEEEGERALAHLAEVIQYEGPENVAAIILETVVGTNGVLVPPDAYLPGVRDLCDEHGILLILDEVMVGFGRTGAWFAADHWDVRARPALLRQGRQLRLRAPRRRRHDRRHRRDLRRARLPRRAHLLRAPARPARRRSAPSGPWRTTA